MDMRRGLIVIGLLLTIFPLALVSRSLPIGDPLVVSGAQVVQPSPTSPAANPTPGNTGSSNQPVDGGLVAAVVAEVEPRIVGATNVLWDLVLALGFGFALAVVFFGVSLARVRSLLARRIGQVGSEIAELTRRLTEVDRGVGKIGSTGSGADDARELRRRMDELADELAATRRVLAALQERVEREPPGRVTHTEDTMSGTSDWKRPVQETPPGPADVPRNGPRREQDGMLQTVIDIYERCRGSEKFVPFARIVDQLIALDVTTSEEESTRVINRLARAYPEVIHIEEIRNRKGLHLAIY